MTPGDLRFIEKEKTYECINAIKGLRAVTWGVQRLTVPGRD